ncbi:MAG: hypothetical protein F6K42_02220 [Leptolyngbya sp. SIO1D8]|nr:hypothetical protein [Leptolyngbya sp. SIO1D8]
MVQTNTVNDIVGQARQGSVAAIIQILNEQMATAGVRTRAMLADGILQLLCEAPTAEQLPQAEIVNQVRDVLENLSPKHIRKVNVNSRIVREEQLLWLEEITRDPEKQLLWAELITLKQPNFIKRFWQDLRRSRAQAQAKIVIPESKRNPVQKKIFLRGLVGGASLCLFLVLVGWTLKHRLGISWTQAQPVTEATPEASSSPAALTPAQDSFAQAVRLAEQAALDGQAATTPADWLELAARWQRASDLMALVPSEDGRHVTAQDRVLAYQQNSEQALLRAEQLQQAEEATSPEENVGE